MGPHLLRPGQTVMFGEKITLAYEALGFDPNATIASSPKPQAAPTGGAETFRVEQDYSPPPAPREEPPASPAYTPAYPPAAEFQSPPPYSPPPSPAYTGQVPPGPADASVYPDLGPAEIIDEEEEEAPNRTRRMLLVGCGTLVVMACCLVAAAFAFDYFNMYCSAPFTMFDEILWSCP
jgi:hypothetical protein